MRLSFDITPWEVRMLSDMFNEEEQKDDDAEDEQCDCDDEPAEKTDDAKAAEEWREAITKLVRVLIGIGHNGPDSDDAMGRCCKR